MIEINIWYILGSLVATFLLAGIRIIRPFEKGLHERFGKFIGERQQGFRWIIIGIDRLVKVDITENMVDIQPQKIITKKNQTMMMQKNPFGTYLKGGVTNE